MSNSTRRSLLKFFLTVLVIVAGLVGCGNKETGEVQVGLTPSPIFNSPFKLDLIAPQNPSPSPSATLTIAPTATLFVPASLFDAELDIMEGPVDVPLELQIPSINVDVPVIGVGLTQWNVMDAPTSSLGSPYWHSAFWYRGSSIPGDIGTATFAGHITDPLGKPGAFRYLQDLQVGALVIIQDNRNSIEIRFIVDEVMIVTKQEFTDPALLTLVYGAGPVAGTGPQPSLDGLSHLTLITCAANLITGNFDDRTVIFATRAK
jgi:sortase (surface protein transpeptidase)